MNDIEKNSIVAPGNNELNTSSMAIIRTAVRQTSHIVSVTIPAATLANPPNYLPYGLAQVSFPGTSFYIIESNNPTVPIFIQPQGCDSLPYYNKQGAKLLNNNAFTHLTLVNQNPTLDVTISLFVGFDIFIDNQKSILIDTSDPIPVNIIGPSPLPVQLSNSQVQLVDNVGGVTNYVGNPSALVIANPVQIYNAPAPAGLSAVNSVTFNDQTGSSAAQPGSAIPLTLFGRKKVIFCNRSLIATDVWDVVNTVNGGAICTIQANGLPYELEIGGVFSVTVHGSNPFTSTSSICEVYNAVIQN